MTVLAGIRIGHAHCAMTRTGVTLILPDAPVVMGVDVRGGGPGTRETDALKADTLVERVHALVLAGGSVFGLAAADAVALALARQGVGLEIGGGIFNRHGEDRRTAFVHRAIRRHHGDDRPDAQSAQL